ncbi:MAG: PorP/SprF family type IX secretion system membrane protein [Bacteroidota bacterium]|nr:PorP/SprF family type IX secretion system membrane protein [Bacteroidota bacterium]
MFRRFTYRLILLLVICSVFEQKAKAQEYPWSLQYVTNMHTINPAYVGIWDKAGLLLSSKTNWVGIHGAPLTQYLGYFTPIKDQRSGVGLSIKRLNTGREKRLFLTGDYSFQVRTDLNHYLRFGLRGGIVNFSNNLSDYQTYPDHIPDPEFTDNIQILMTTFGIGTVFFTEDYYIGFSVPEIINNTFSVNVEHISSLYNFKTVFLSAGYVFGFNRTVFLRPNLLIAATIGEPVYADASAIVYLPNDLQFGLNLRTNGTVCFSGQYSFSNNIRIGFAADYAAISDIRKYQIGTYEVLVGYDFNIYKRKYTKPHYF